MNQPFCTAKRLTTLSKSPRIENAIAAVGVHRVLGASRTAAATLVPPAEFFPAGGPAGITAPAKALFRDTAAAVIGQAFRDHNRPVRAGELRAALDRRFQEFTEAFVAGMSDPDETLGRAERWATECSAAGPHAEVEAAKKLLGRTSTARDRAVKAVSETQAGIDAIRPEIDAKVETADRALSNIERAVGAGETVNTNHPATIRPYIPIPVAAVLVVMFFAPGQSLFRSFVYALTLTALGVSAYAIVRRRRSRASGTDGVSVGHPALVAESHRLLQPLRDDMLNYYELSARNFAAAEEEKLARSVADGLEAAPWLARVKALGLALAELETVAAREVALLPEGPFEENMPGDLEVIGSHIAEILLDKRVPDIDSRGALAGFHASFEREHRNSFAGALLAGPGTAVYQKLVATVRACVGRPDLTEILAAVVSEPEGEGAVLAELNELGELAGNVFRLPEIDIDRRNIVSMLWVGLPKGQNDAALVQLLGRAFPQKPRFGFSFDQDSIELVWSAIQLKNSQSILHEIGGRCLEKLSEKEDPDILWHFPRRSSGKALPAPTPVGTPVREPNIPTKVYVAIPAEDGNGRN
jgi:hypothetical protein